MRVSRLDTDAADATMIVEASQMNNRMIVDGNYGVAQRGEYIGPACGMGENVSGADHEAARHGSTETACLEWVSIIKDVSFDF